VAGELSLFFMAEFDVNAVVVGAHQDQAHSRVHAYLTDRAKTGYMELLQPLVDFANSSGLSIHTQFTLNAFNLCSYSMHRPIFYFGNFI
jgi:hypothetical protein